MASSEINVTTHGPNLVHPETPSAVGSRNSMNRHNRDEYAEARLMVDEEVDKIMNHLHAKLPPEASSRLEIMAGIKSKLHPYYNQNLQNMLNRYITTVEDELSKKVRDMVDMEELRGLNRYTPRSIAYLLDRIGGSEKFNSGEIEKSIVNMFGHLQGHVQREMNDLETHTNSLLRRKTDVGAFVRGENAYSIAKCSFRDHPDKPTNVFELKLAMNILDAELISSIFPFTTTALSLLKDLLTKRIYDAIDREVEKINMDLVDEGKPEMSPEEKIFERIRLLENYISDEDTEGSRRFSLMPKKFMDSLGDLGSEELSEEEFDSLSLRQNVVRILDGENIRNRGWNTAVNAITHILDWSRMSYQHIENYKSLRRAIIREYESTDSARLPDERYRMELVYYDAKQLQHVRDAYIAQLAELERTVAEVWKVVEGVYQDHRVESSRDDWDSFSEKVMGGGEDGTEKRRSWSWFATQEETPAESETEEVKPRQWNEISFITASEGDSIQSNPTLEMRMRELKERFPRMLEKLETVFEEKNPELRQQVEARIVFLQGEFNRFSAQVNPYHVQPGLLLDVDIVTIKRKSTTMMMMANVLNEFLAQVSRGFSDAAFAGFSRRRSTQREDLTGEFTTGTAMVDVASESAGPEEVFE